MLLFDGALGLLMFGLWIFCIIDVITTPDGVARNLPKLLWLLIVILLLDVGSIAWLVAGHPWNATQELGSKGNRGAQALRSRTRTPARAANPDDDEEFLASLRTRAEEQRRRARDEREQPPGTPPNA